MGKQFENAESRQLIFSNYVIKHCLWWHNGDACWYSLTTDAPVYMGYLYRMSERNGTNETLYRTRQIHQEFIGDTAYRYTYDAVGNITKIEVGERKTKGSSESVAVNYTLLVEYQYDDDYQLYRENNKQLNKTIIYDYSHGNRTTRREYAFSQESFPTTAPVKTTTYTYGDGVWGDLLTGISEGSSSQSITYDKIGNPTAYKGYTMTWTGRELTGLSGNGLYASFKYDADGLRTEKAADGVTSKYYYVGGKLYYEKRGAKELYYFYDSIGNLAMIRYYTGSGEENYNYYVATNSRGDVEAIYRGNGTVKARYIYDTWGKVISVVNENGQEITSQNDIGLINPIRYRGYYYDQETGYYYLQSRYYDPDTGRFISADGYVAGVGGNTQGYNLFSYCFNNPVNMTDETGSWPSWNDVGNFFKDIGDAIADGVKAVGNFFSDNFGTQTTTTVVEYENKATTDFFFFKVTETNSVSYNIEKGASKTVTGYADTSSQKVGVKVKVGNVSGNIGTGLDGLLSEKASIKFRDTTYSFGFKEKVILADYTFSIANGNTTQSYSIELNKLNIAAAVIAPYLIPASAGEKLIEIFG